MFEPSNSIKLDLWVRLFEVRALLQKNLERPLSAHGIGMSEFMILHTLSNAPEQRISRIHLAESVSLTASAITKLLSPMEKLHWVAKEKHERDARMSLVVLTESGRTLYHEALATLNANLESALARLSDQEIHTLLALLAKI